MRARASSPRRTSTRSRATWRRATARCSRTFAALIGVKDADRAAFYAFTQQNFASIFASENTTELEVLASLEQLMAREPQLAAYAAEELIVPCGPSRSARGPAGSWRLASALCCAHLAAASAAAAGDVDAAVARGARAAPRRHARPGVHSSTTAARPSAAAGPARPTASPSSSRPTASASPRPSSRRACASCSRTVPTAPDVHPRCRFPARYAWLARELGFRDDAGARLPRLPGVPRGARPRRRHARSSPRPSSTTRPRCSATPCCASTRARARTCSATRSTSPARRAATGGFVYAARGLTGGYQGYFAVEPYYEKVKNYGDWENRDIWEYQLALSPEELDLLLAHLWELQGISFDYYYFDENCSQQLLALLEAARPALREREFVPPWVIPADTVRAAVRHDLVTDVRYRPSAATRLRYAASLLSRDERRLALAIAAGDVAPDAPQVQALPPASRAALLDVAYDLLRYRYLGRDVERDASAGLARQILLARSQVGVRGAPPEPPRPAFRPDEGHDTARASLGRRRRSAVTPFVEARFRPAFHDLLDPRGGYVRGAQIDFFDTALRVYPGVGARTRAGVRRARTWSR